MIIMKIEGVYVYVCMYVCVYVCMCVCVSSWRRWGTYMEDSQRELAWEWVRMDNMYVCVNMYVCFG